MWGQKMSVVFNASGMNVVFLTTLWTRRTNQGLSRVSWVILTDFLALVISQNMTILPTGEYREKSLFLMIFFLINHVSFSQPGKFIWLLCQQQLQYITPKKERPLHVLNHHHHPCLKPSFSWVRVETRYNDRCAKGAVKLYHYFEESLYGNSRYNDMLEK